MNKSAQKDKKQRELRKKEIEKKYGGYVILKEELTLRNVIKTQEQADFFMKMLKALK